MKYYAVRNGRSNGVYKNWSDCESQVKGYSRSEFKSFSSKSEADAYMSSGNSKSSSTTSYGSTSSYSSAPYSNRNSKSSYSSSSSSSHNSRSYKPSESYGSSGNYEPSESYSAASSYSSYQTSRPSSYHRESPSKTSDKTVRIYTDGASKNNQASKHGLSKAGYGVYYGPNDSRNYSGRVDGEQTNQRGELQGIKHALSNVAKEIKNGNDCQKYEIHTDSQYSKDSITKWSSSWEKNGWKTSTGADVKNQDLIKSCVDLYNEIKTHPSADIDFVKVKGHSGNHGNDMADKLAVEGCLKE